jgi:cation diffusion facilitator family transporter
LKLLVGLAIGSVSVLAEAIHSAVDLAAAVIAFFSVRIAARPADADHHFGHGKAENVSGTIEGLLIFVGSGVIVYEAINRLTHGAKLEEPDLGIAVMTLSVIVNTLVSRHLFRVAKQADSLALEADAEHLRTDVWTSFGVLGGLVLVRITGIAELDPLLALGVAALIIKAAYSITRRSFVDLLDRQLPSEEQAIIERILREHRGRFIGYHKLRSRKSGPHRHIDLHLVFRPRTSVAQAHRLCDELEDHIQEALPHSTVTIHVEPPEAVDRC